MTLSTYHQKYANQPDAEIQNKTDEKRQELSAIFEQARLKTIDDVVRVAVVGCGDKRFIQHHKEILEQELFPSVRKLIKSILNPKEGTVFARFEYNEDGEITKGIKNK